MPSLLVTRPNHDLPTTYLFHWSKLVIDFAERKRIIVYDLAGDRANLKNFQSYIKRNDPILVFFNGHGSTEEITGINNEILVDINKSQELLKDTLIYARSCNCGSILGKVCIKNGAKVFIGYKKKFSLAYLDDNKTRPLQDNLAKLFLEPSNLIPISLLKGNTAGISYKKSQTAMLKNISFMLSSQASREQMDAAQYLWRNRKYQVLLGEANSKI